MKFDMKNIHTIFESAKSKNCVPSEHADESGTKMDATLGDTDLIKLFDNICPICGDVFASMKDAAADPKNLKLTMVKTEDLGESTKVYIEAVEFATFCEAANLTVGEAAEEIIDTCKGMVPGSNDSELHVVFPSESLNKGELGSTRFGYDTRNDWAMQLLTGCRRYGIAVNSGVEDGEPDHGDIIGENAISKIREKIKKKHNRSQKINFSKDQYEEYSKAIRDISKKFDHIGKYLTVLKYSDICDLGYYPSDGEYWVAVFDTDDHRNDKEIRSYERGNSNNDFVKNLNKEVDSFVKELNSLFNKNYKNVKFDSNFDGHRFELYMIVDEDGSIKESVKYTNDSKETIHESTVTKNFKGVKIQIDGSSEQIATAIRLCNTNWDAILDEAAKRMFEYSKEMDFEGSPKNLRSVKAIRNALNLESVFYDNEGNKHNPICGSMNLSFDTKPSLDPHHSFTLYVDFDKNQNIRFDSVYDG